MASNERWLLPEGVEELLPAEAWHLEKLRRELLDLFYTYGFDLVTPPLIEYMDALLTGTGRDMDIQTFKLIDQLSGRLMGLRADITPQVARLDAHFLKRNGPTRLCYIGPTLYTRPEPQGGSREPLQLGAELFGCTGPAADSEILQMMVDVLQVCGLDQPHIEIGHVGVFRKLARNANFDVDQEADLFDVLQRKSIPDLMALSDSFGINEAQRNLYRELMEISGTIEVLGQAEALCADSGDEVLAALSEIRMVAEHTQKALPNLNINFDLAELRGYQYHTGILFSAFVSGYGQAVAKGGRYDDIGKAFGHPRPATGFSADLRQLVKLSSKRFAVAKAIAAPISEDPELKNAVLQQRSKGERVVHLLGHESDDDVREYCDRRLVKHSGNWLVESI